MSLQKKRAWYNRGIPVWLPMLISIPCGASLYFLVGPAAGTVTFYVLMIGLTVFLARRQDPNAVTTDERVEMLQHKAMWYGASAILYMVVLGFSALAYTCSLQGKSAVTIQLKYLSVIMLAGFCFFFVVTAVTYLIMRYRGEHHGEE